MKWEIKDRHKNILSLFLKKFVHFVLKWHEFIQPHPLNHFSWGKKKTDTKWFQMTADLKQPILQRFNLLISKTFILSSRSFGETLLKFEII